jgi:hypothetical protein
MTPDARAARERKQKIFVAVGGIFLLAMLAIQLPKLLGGSGGSEAATQVVTTTPASAAAGAPAVGSPTAAPVSLVGRARPGLPTTGKLSSFGAFERKDPFVQQVVTSDAPADGGTASTGSASAGVGKGTKKAAEASKKFALGQKSATTPALTVVSVNGGRQALAPGGTFPSSDPVFVLVAEHPESKSVEIGVVGGAYSGGSKTTKLVAGKPLTLVNTTTGARYRLLLVAVGSGEAAKPASAK